MMEEPAHEYSECQLIEARDIIIDAVNQCKAKNINPECFKDALFMYLSTSYQCMYGKKWSYAGVCISVSKHGTFYTLMVR